MTAAVITLGLVLLAAVTAIVLLVRKIGSFPEELVAYGKAQVQAEQNQVEAEKQRDTALALAARTAAELDRALIRLATAEAARNAALERKADAAAVAIQNANDPLAALNGVLQDVPDVSRAGAAGDARADHGRQGADAVPAAVDAGAADDARLARSDITQPGRPSAALRRVP